MEKKRWNQNYLDKYDDIMKQLYHAISDILKEKLGEEVIINYQLSGWTSHEWKIEICL